MLTIDFHSHLAHTEIIGLLGGIFDHSTQTIHITKIHPCKSIRNNTTQCELDPSSELEARLNFTNSNVNVIGWYHSHPTFQSIPSTTDIETQISYQVRHY
jgi:proteasome lid subunit RPN8/RPN11